LPRFIGNGVLIYFGSRQAHEDDARRAVRAGLALIEAVGKLRSQEPL
jgi:class 3 adenylate cyclase